MENRMKGLDKKIDWFCSLIRIAGVNFPVAASFVQLQAEISSNVLLKRVQKLEDPVSFLHEDIPELSKHIYQVLKENESLTQSFDDEIYERYSRALAVLESQGYIEGTHCVGKRFGGGVFLCDASFIMYMCALVEDKSKMEQLFNLVNSCAFGLWLDGKEIKTKIDLPLPVIKAIFEIFESKGFGLCSKENGTAMYLAQTQQPTNP